MSFIGVLRKPNSLIWNSRAPYATFLINHSNLNKYHRITRIAYNALERICCENNPNDLTVEVFAKPRTNDKVKIDLKKFSSISETIGKTTETIKSQYDLLDESVLIKISSNFESFSKCWCCNMLLSTLENKKSSLKSKKRWFTLWQVKVEYPLPREGLKVISLEDYLKL